jgi:hypothetical protein
VEKKDKPDGLYHHHWHHHQYPHTYQPTSTHRAAKMVEDAVLTLPDEEMRQAAPAIKCRVQACFEANRMYFE